ncbi:MAG: DMT family transporter [Aeromonadaceae bacterium]|nr:DMT family transporter [Aeromonadaceae bacterium]MBP8065254.1 DMT family transporter [Aeromonadaceae bacterium]MBP9570100.1 DMT family transporter [Aeromonadaceae bacterium]
MSKLPSPFTSSSLAALAPMAAAIGAMFSITLGASLAKSLFPLIGPAGTTVLRLGIAAVMLALAFRVWRIRLVRAQWLAVIPYALSLSLMNLLFYMAIERVPLGIALAIEFIGPLTVALLGSRRRGDFIWLGLAVGGLLLVLPLRGAGQSIDPLGALLSLGAGVCWGLYIITGRRAGRALGASTPAFGMAIGTLVVLPFGWGPASSGLLDPAILSVAVAVAVLSSAIPYTLEMYALRRLPPQSFGTLTSCEPAVGALVGMTFLGESLPPSQLLGIAAIIVASVGTTLAARRCGS